MKRIPRTVKVIVVLIIVVLLGKVTFDRALAALNPGPAQPIPFSHRIHATTKQISCFFCHQYATVSDHPGIPQVEKCLLCHRVIASNFRPIRRILEYKARNQGIPWVRVGVVPDFVFFSHQIHLARRFDCSRCHGNVMAMDRIRQVNVFNMGFCVNCHWANGASTDCYTCHR